MKILISTDMYGCQINGIVNSVVALRDELKNLGHDVRVLALSPTFKSQKENDNYYISSVHVPVYPDARFSFKRRDKLLDEIIEWAPDIVHIQTEFSSRMLVNRIIKKLGIKYVATCHTMYEDYVTYICPSKKLGKLIVKKLSNRYYNHSKMLIVPSSKLKTKEEEYGVKCPITVLPTGIELERYQKKLFEKERAELLSGLNLPDSKKYIVTVCRLAHEKNIDEIIRYLPALLKQDREIKFIIVGDGPYKHQLQKMVKEMGLQDNVVFTGMINPEIIYKYYQLGSVFVCASTSESQGLTYLEALASGLPMVCKRDDCLNDILDDGKNGFIFDNQEEFVTGVMKIINNKELAKNMSEKSFVKSNNFSKAEFGRKMEKIYKEILEQT